MSDSMYQRAILELAESAHGHGLPAAADGEALLDNPLCGDRVTVFVRREGEIVAALGHQVRGCLLCRAAASLLGRKAAGRPIAELAALPEAVASMLSASAGPPAGWEELSAFDPVRAHRSRHGCVLLPFQALAAALAADRSVRAVG
jgi:nitrogen fixation NifU-like protein